MSKSSKFYNRLIILVSLTIPIVVGILFNIKLESIPPLKMLPPIYATINGLTAILLIVALFYIKNGKRKNHEITMKVNIFLSLMFLVMYIACLLYTSPSPRDDR